MASRRVTILASICKLPIIAIADDRNFKTSLWSVKSTVLSFWLGTTLIVLSPLLLLQKRSGRLCSRPVKVDERSMAETHKGKRINMNNMNFFGWIRDGVRQSVLLGVSDAVEQLGTPTAVEDLHPSVAGFLKMDQAAHAAPRLNPSQATSDSSTNPKSRRRLGKSLKDIGTESGQ